MALAKKTSSTSFLLLCAYLIPATPPVSVLNTRSSAFRSLCTCSSMKYLSIVSLVQLILCILNTEMSQLKGHSVTFILLWSNIWKKQLKRGEVYLFSSQFRGIQSMVIKGWQIEQFALHGRSQWCHCSHVGGPGSRGIGPAVEHGYTLQGIVQLPTSASCTSHHRVPQGSQVSKHISLGLHFLFKSEQHFSRENFSDSHQYQFNSFIALFGSSFTSFKSTNLDLQLYCSQFNSLIGLQLDRDRGCD